MSMWEYFQKLTIQIPVEAKIFSSLNPSRTALGPTKPPLQRLFPH